MNAPVELSSRARSWNLAMSASPGDLDLEIPASAIEGSIPSLLRGTRMLSNGPGWTRIGEWTAHPFDGHGYVRAFSFEADGSCRLRARFVRTPSYVAERESGRMVHRGFATNLEGPFWRNLRFGVPRNVANTTVTRWGDRLLVGWEGGRPYALDATTLETQGEETLGGALEGQTTLAHFKHDRALGRLVLCSLAGRGPTRLVFRELDEHGRIVTTSEVSLSGLRFSHDFAMTPSTFVLSGNPLRPKLGELAKMLIGKSTLLRSVTTDLRSPGTLHLVPRGGDGAVRTIELPGPAFIVHFGNAFEAEGTLHVDACVFSDFELGEELGYTGPTTPFDPSLPDARDPQSLVRITVPPGATEATWSRLTEHGVDFPRFHPDREGFETPLLLGATRKDPRYSDPFDSVICVSTRDRDRPAALWTAPPDVFVGEPLFAPEPDHDDRGHVLTVLSDGNAGRSTLAILDVTRLAQGPVAAIPMPLLPIAFHGDWDARGSALRGADA